MLRVQFEGKDMEQNYGVLRVVRVRPPANATTHLSERYPSGWLPEKRLVHLLTQHETTIGRALNNDVVLMDPTVSREHARLVFDDDGWHIVNLTDRNVVRVNGRMVPGGSPGQRWAILILTQAATLSSHVRRVRPLRTLSRWIGSTHRSLCRCAR